MFAFASNFVQSVDSTFYFIVAVCVFFLVLITVLMLVFVYKYNSKRNKKAKNIHGSLPLEITWTLIPTLLVLVMFYLGWTGYEQMVDVPKDAMVVDVYAQMWQWSFKYANGVEADTLYVPINKPVKVLLHSRDVDHSFYVPAFKTKKDVIPGRTNFAWFKATHLGTYDVLCAEYCGLRHSYMYSAVVVMPVDQYNAWMAKQKAKQDKDDADINNSTSNM